MPLRGKMHVEETTNNAERIDCLVPESVQPTFVVDYHAVKELLGVTASFLSPLSC